MKIIDRYIMSEMLGPFLFGVCAFTLLFFSAETLMGVPHVRLTLRPYGLRPPLGG